MRGMEAWRRELFQGEEQRAQDRAGARALSRGSTDTQAGGSREARGGEAGGEPLAVSLGSEEAGVGFESGDGGVRWAAYISEQRSGCRGQRGRPDQLGYWVTQASLLLWKLRPFCCSWFYNLFSKCSPRFNACYARTCKSLLQPNW